MIGKSNSMKTEIGIAIVSSSNASKDANAQQGLNIDKSSHSSKGQMRR